MKCTPPYITSLSPKSYTETNRLFLGVKEVTELHNLFRSQQSEGRGGEAPFRNGSIVRQQQKDGIVCGNLRGKLHATEGSLFQHRTLATLSLRITGGIGLLLLTYLRNRVLRQTALQPIGDRPVFWEEETRPCKKRRLTPLHGS